MIKDKNQLVCVCARARKIKYLKLWFKRIYKLKNILKNWRFRFIFTR